jgi:hypothetical protein
MVDRTTGHLTGSAEPHDSSTLLLFLPAALLIPKGGERAPGYAAPVLQHSRFRRQFVSCLIEHIPKA